MTQEHSLFLSVRKIHDLVVQSANVNLKSYDLTVSQMLLLCYCLNFGDEFVYQRELERYFDLSHVTVIGLLKRLSENNYVRIEISETDRRQRKVFLTERAYSIAADIERQITEFEQMLTDTLSENEIQSMQKYLDIVYHNLISQSEKQKGSRT
mgnify:FL=1